MNKYKISIVMAVYNAEKYLDETINSILFQTINFKENVQLILVNDGSKDNSEEICIKYKNLYPVNIIYIKQKNGGVSSARNNGLNNVLGKYVTFTDSDDLLTKDTLENMYNFLEENKLKMATLQIEYFERLKGFHPLYDELKEMNPIIDLKENPYHYILSSAATFYNVDWIRNHRFDESLRTGEDLLFNVLLYLKKDTFGVLPRDKGRYMYRQRNESGSLIDKTHTELSWYKDDIDIAFTKIFEQIKDEVPLFLKRLILREVLLRLRVNKAFIEKMPLKQKEELLEIYGKFVKYVDDDEIMKYKTEYQYKCVLFNIKNGYYHFDAKLTVSKLGPVYYGKESNRLANIKAHTLKIHDLKYGNKRFYFNCLLNDYIGEEFKIEIYKNNNLLKEVKYTKLQNSEYHKKSMGVQVLEAYLVKFEIPAANGLYYIKITTKNWSHQIKFVPTIHSPVVLNLENMKIFRNNKMLIFNNNEIKIKTRRKKTQIKNEYRIFKHIYQKYKKFPIYRIFGYKKKNIWLINDRKDVAMDNGEAMFKYLSKKKEIKKNVYFAIDKKSSDWKYLKKYGKVVKHGSIFHKILYMKAKYVISSHTMSSFYKPFTDGEDVMYNDLHEHKFIFLQHGIIINEVSKVLNKYNRNVDLFVTSTIKEQQFIQQERYMYKKNEVILTGLPRYDYLKSVHEKIIVIIPTWRTYINFGKTASGYEKFTKSKFYQSYKLVLENKKLRKHLKKHGYKIKFLLHQEMKYYASSFRQYENEQIEILNPGEESYKSLVSRASLFITDYSSISFDFAYLLKPIIYYQFDKDDFFNNHYSKGYFDYEKDGFGKVVTESEKLINFIIHNINNKCMMSDEYINKTKETFKYIDDSNCERVYNEIMKI